MSMRSGPRNSRRRASALLVVAIAAAMVAAACGSSKKSSSSGGGATTTLKPKQLTGTPIKIGALFTLSGPTAAVGERSKKGLEYWKQTVGDVVGIDGHPVELDIKDDTGAATGAIAAVRQLIDEDHVNYVIGPFLSGASGGVLPLLNTAKVININESAFPDSNNPTKSPYTFQIEYTKEAESPGYLSAADDTGGKKLGILAVDNALGASQIDGITKEQQTGKYKVSLVTPVRFPSGVTDASAQVKKMKDEGADVVLVTAVASSDYVAIFKAMDELGYDVPVIGNSAVAFPEVTAASPAGIVKNIRVSGFSKPMLEPLSAGVKQFRTGYKKFLGQDPLKDTMWNAVTAYDAASLIKFGVEGAKSTDADAIKGYLEANPFHALKETFNFSATSHAGLHEDQLVFAKAGTFKDGTLEPVS